MPPKRRRASTSRSPSPKRKKVEKDDSDYNTWTVQELRTELSSKSLSTKGTKKELVDRLNGKEPEAPSPSSRPKRAAAKKKVESDDDDDSEEAPVRAAPKRKAPARAAPKRPVRSAAKNKRNYEGSSDSEDDQSENSDSESSQEEPVVVNRGTSSRAPKVKTNPWIVEDTVVYHVPDESNDSIKLAAFDMDSTLIATKSGKKFATGRNDWKWLFPEVPEKLKEYHANGYRVVIFSNQGGVGKGNTTLDTVAGKIMDLSKDSGVPIAFVFATGDDKYRKPATGMWTFLEEKLGKTFDVAESFYVGDAAGRAEGWKPGYKKDFGCSDRKFAQNIPIPFHTPEEFFLGEAPVPFDWRGVIPKDVPTSGKFIDNEDDLTSSSQEMILFVGPPAAGKSTFAQTHLVPKGYVRVNRDTLKTQPKCLKAAKEALAEGKSVVIDNTNPDSKSRAPYISLAEEFSVPVRCFHFQTSLDLAQHLNEFREVITNGAQPHVPTMVYRMYNKNFQEPDEDEGITQIKKINFVRNHPDDAHKTVFEKFTERHS